MPQKKDDEKILRLWAMTTHFNGYPAILSLFYGDGSMLRIFEICATFICSERASTSVA